MLHFQRNTEGRISIVHHEVVPHYMRTKLDLDLEAKQKELEDHVASKGAELSGEVKKFNEMLSSGIDRVTEMREELEEQKTRTGEKEQLSITCIIIIVLSELR